MCVGVRGINSWGLRAPSWEPVLRAGAGSGVDVALSSSENHLGWKRPLSLNPPLQPVLLLAPSPGVTSSSMDMVSLLGMWVLV